MDALQYGALSRPTALQYFPEETVTTNIPVATPLLEQDVKDFLRIYVDVDENYLDLLITGATEQVERYCGVATTPRTMESYWSSPSRLVALPVRPITNISNVVSVARDGTETALVAGTDYDTIGLKDKKIILKTTVSALKITYDAGYASNTCPEAIRGAIFQEVSFQYKNRQDSNQPARTSFNGLSIEARHLLISGGFYDYAR